MMDNKEFWKEVGKTVFLAAVEGVSLYAGQEIGKKVGNYLVPPPGQDRQNADDNSAKEEESKFHDVKGFWE